MMRFSTLLLASAATFAAVTSTATALAQEDPAAPEPPYLRGGASLGGGYGGYGGGRGPVSTLSFRVGARLHRVFSLSYQITGLLTFYSRTLNETYHPTVVAGGLYTTALAGFTLGDRVELSLGPALDALYASACLGNSCKQDTFFAPGVHARAAVTLVRFIDARGGPNGLTLGVDGHGTFRSGMPLTVTGSVGWEWY